MSKAAEVQGHAWWQDRSWYRKNWKALIGTIIIIVGAIGTLFLLREDVAENTVVLKEVEIRVDSLDKKHTILNHSFTSFRVSMEKDIADIEECMEDISEEQSETHDLTIRIAERLGVGE